MAAGVAWGLASSEVTAVQQQQAGGQHLHVGVSAGLDHIAIYFGWERGSTDGAADVFLGGTSRGSWMDKPGQLCLACMQLASQATTL